MSKSAPKAIRAYRFFAVSDTGEIRSSVGNLVWSAPTRKPGAWVRHDGEIICCVAGLHASKTVLGCLRNRQGETLALVEARQIADLQDDKFAAREMRIVRLYSQQHLASLATVAAIMSLPIFERRYPHDVRPHKAIECVIEWIRTGKRPTYAAAADASAADAYAAYAYAVASAASAAASAASVASADASTAADAATVAAAYAAFAADASASARLTFDRDFERQAVRLMHMPKANLPKELAALLASTAARGTRAPRQAGKKVDTRHGGV